jgi:hypothetical protein
MKNDERSVRGGLGASGSEKLNDIQTAQREEMSLDPG